MSSNNVSPSAVLTIIIPVFNEEAHISDLAGRLVQTLELAGVTWSALFVDDGSSDATLPKLRALAQTDARFQELALSRK